jgi:hypothetical protein
MQESLWRLAGIAEPELPILASEPTNNHWLAVTTDRVVFQFGEQVIAIHLRELEDVRSLVLENGQSTRDDVIVLRTSGARYEVCVERGYPLGGIWNVLRRFQRVWATVE